MITALCVSEGRLKRDYASADPLIIPELLRLTHSPIDGISTNRFPHFYGPTMADSTRTSIGLALLIALAATGCLRPWSPDSDPGIRTTDLPQADQEPTLKTFLSVFMPDTPIGISLVCPGKMASEQTMTEVTYYLINAQTRTILNRY